MSDQVKLDLGRLTVIRSVMSTIYLMQNLVTKDTYVGATRDLKKRVHQHRWAMKMGKHPNSEIQRLSGLYGRDSFIYESLAEVEPEHLSEAEQLWIDKIHPTLNRLAGGHGTGDKPPQKESTKELISQALKGRTKTPEHRANIALARATQAPTRTQTWGAIDSNGVRYVFDNLRQWADDHGFKYKTLHLAMKQGRTFHGWRFTHE